MEYPGTESSLKGEKLRDKPPKLKIFRRSKTTHEYRRHSAVLLQTHNVYEDICSKDTATFLLITFISGHRMVIAS
jgi:hypothetical protein